MTCRRAASNSRQRTDDRDDERVGHEDQQVIAAQRLQDERRRKQAPRIATGAARREHAIERVQHQREELDVLRLQVHERVSTCALKAYSSPAIDPAHDAAGPSPISRYIDQPDSARPAMISRL